MLVETYEVPEVGYDGETECEAEALALIEQLGLDGQKSLVSGESDPTRCPYRKMTSQERFVYGSLMPKHTKLRDYKDAAIPLRVLQVAAHANEMFGCVYVWHPENGDDKDPLLVGTKEMQGTYKNETHYFILARWGDVLERFEKLAEKACGIHRAKVKAECLKIARKVQALLAAADEIPYEAVLEGSLKVPSFYE